MLYSSGSSPRVCVRVHAWMNLELSLSTHDVIVDEDGVPQLLLIARDCMWSPMFSVTRGRRRGAAVTVWPYFPTRKSRHRVTASGFIAVVLTAWDIFPFYSLPRGFTIFHLTLQCFMINGAHFPC